MNWNPSDPSVVTGDTNSGSWSEFQSRERLFCSSQGSIPRYDRFCDRDSEPQKFAKDIA